MSRTCPVCREPIQGEREEIGARCPRCRLPLYERPELFKRRPPATDNVCARHPENPAPGACPRCGNFVCELCRTRWRDRWLCIACVERALEANETRPDEVRAQARQAILALVFGLAGWGAMLAAFVAVALAMASSAKPDLFVLGLVGLVLLASPIPSVLGVGQAAAVLRARGSYLILGTIGLILSASHVGALIGLFGMALWQK